MKIRLFVSKKFPKLDFFTQLYYYTELWIYRNVQQKWELMEIQNYAQDSFSLSLVFYY
jgi:hypothetical protein